LVNRVNFFHQSLPPGTCLATRTGRVRFHKPSFCCPNNQISFVHSLTLKVLFISFDGIGKLRLKIVSHNPELVLFCPDDVFRPVVFCWICVVNHKRLVRQQSGFDKPRLSVSGFQLIQRNAQVGFKKHLLVKRCFARCLNATKNQDFHFFHLDFEN